MKVLQIVHDYFNTSLYALLFDSLSIQGVKSVNLAAFSGTSSMDGISVPKGFVTLETSTLDRILFFPKQAKILSAVAAQVDIASIDVVHAHTLFSGGYTAMQLYRRYGIPYITAVRNTDVNVFFRWMPHLRRTGVHILQNAERIIFLSPAYQEQVFSQYVPAALQKELEEKSLVIPNGIPPLFFENPPPPRAEPSAVPRLIYVGEVSSNKNLELTVQAAELLRQSGREVHLTAVGPVKDKSCRALTQKVDEYHDRCPQKEVLGYLRRADIFVMPSHTETFGLVYAEAMSQGLPVLYTRGQGFDGQFPDGTVGYTVSDRDPRELADRIEQVLSEYGRLSENCVRLAGKFDWGVIAEQYRKLYFDCIRRQKP